MNMNQIINMFTRLVMRRAMNWGINKGIGQMTRKSPPQKDGVQQDRIQKDGVQQDGAEGQQAGARPRGGQQNKQTQDLAKRMRTLGRMTRR
ncbi:MAG: hypothetical protein ACK4YU_11345 [Paracoccus sp. (in: a-proteobacteria)]